MSYFDYSSSILSILPAALALLLAIFTRRVLLSLSVGIIIGSLLLFNLNPTETSFHFNPLDSISYLAKGVLSLVYGEEGIKSNNICIVLFLLLLGALTSLLTVSGSNKAFAEWAQKHIKNQRGAKLLTASLVFFTFIDDYFHSLAVGAIARPITDKFKVSRAKLAYLLDSTAAPMCVLMPVSSWGAYIITLIAGLLSAHAITGYSPIQAFMLMSVMNLYAIFSIIVVFIVAYFSINIGSMARFEQQALTKVVEADSNEKTLSGKARNLFLPILTLIIATVITMIYTGAKALADNGNEFSILGAFENTNVGISLISGSLISLFVITLCIIVDKQVSPKSYFRAWLTGFKSMYGAILILFFAWTINLVVGDMQTGKYLSSFVADTIPVTLLPAILFILATGMAFSTGTSWGTFGIMLPIAATIVVHLDPSLFLPCLSAVMAGAVCGDHCSPISDTTILSSSGAQCNHMDHVTSQLPYAMVVAFASTLGYLVLGFTSSIFFSFIITAVVIAILLLLLKKKSLK